MKFADIPGHENVKARLRSMADSGKVPHALLLEGPDGIGKFMLARAFAQYIHCENRSNGDSCGVCASCRQHQEFNHIDTVLSFPVIKKDSGKETISNDFIDVFKEFVTESPYMDFDVWREKLGDISKQPQIYVEEAAELIRRLTFMTRRSQYKVAILWLPERLHEKTANKLLKLIEEPFSDTKFVLVSNEPRLILPTIYSRTQRIEVKCHPAPVLEKILIERGFEAETARTLSNAAEGSVNSAGRMAGISERRQQFFDLFTELMRKAYARKVQDLRKWSLDVAALGREMSMQFIDYATRLVRESFVMHLHVDELLTMSAAEREFVNRFYPFINEKNVIDIITRLDLCRRDIAANGNAKIILFDLAVRIIILLRRK